MDKQIDIHFDRVDNALANLIDSITKYHPVQGTDLVVADTELNKGLEEVQFHQRNFARLQQLRNTASSLDTQIKETLTLLAQTRKELISTSATIFPDGPSYPIDYSELLAYARRISKTTLPPAGVTERLQAALQATSNPESGAETAVTTPAGTPQPNGVASTPAATTPAAATPANTSQQPEASQQAATSGGTALPEHMLSELNPLAAAEFVPWPTEDNLRNGALSRIAFLITQGIEPENYDPVEEEARKQREEEEARIKEEKERLEQEERERKLREQREAARREAEKQREKEQAEGWRRASVIGGPGSGASTSAGAITGEKKQFQFMGDDDDESD